MISLLADLVIKVPVIKDIPVRDRIGFQKFDKYSWLRWYQEDTSSPLLWNRGYMIMEPIEPTKPMKPARILATVYAFHVLKPEEALSWIARPGGVTFAIDHYTNFIKSLQLAAANKFKVGPSPKMALQNQ